MSGPRRPRSRAVPPGDDSVASGDFGDDDRGDDARKSGMRRLGRFLGFAGGGAAVLGAVAIGLFPTQTFLDQRASTSEAQQRLAVLREQNASFKQRIDRLGTDAAIERLAREQYNLAFPGEEAYAVLPAPLPPLQLPALWPFGPLLAAAPAPAVTPAP